jgi:hypothetical protein
MLWNTFVTSSSSSSFFDEFFNICLLLGCQFLGIVWNTLESEGLDFNLVFFEIFLDRPEFGELSINEDLSFIEKKYFITPKSINSSSMLFNIKSFFHGYFEGTFPFKKEIGSFPLCPNSRHTC